jgi:hypothetical protein
MGRFIPAASGCIAFVSALLVLTASASAGAAEGDATVASPAPHTNDAASVRHDASANDAAAASHDASAFEATSVTTPAPELPHGPSSNAFPSHRFQWAPRDAKRVQVGVNFGLLQLALGGFNVAAELRYRRLWLEYSHGMALTLNNAGRSGMTEAERQQDLHIYVPYTTGFGAGVTLLDELWLGVEFKAHRFEVNAPGGAATHYETYSIGPVLGYKLFLWRGLHVNAYVRYWPNVATTLDDGKVALQGSNGTVVHEAHGFDFFANVSVGYAFDL